MLKAWMRLLSVTLTSKKYKKSMTFTQDNLAISVNGYKYMSTLKDSCTIQISNLTYSEIVQIIDGEFYDVEVKCGYQSMSPFTIFKGGVLYVSNELGDRRTNVVTILCASDIVAKYGQRRLNLTLNSGINLWSATKYVCRRAGFRDTELSLRLKGQIMQNPTNVYDTAAAWVQKLTQENGTLLTNSEGQNGAVLSLFDANDKDLRVIELTQNNISLTEGYPRLTSEGIMITVMPSFNFKCGDIIKLDNSLINIPVQSASEANKNLGFKLDPTGQYFIYQVQYTLQNRGQAVGLKLVAKSRSLLARVTGIKQN